MQPPTTTSAKPCFCRWRPPESKPMCSILLKRGRVYNNPKYTGMKTMFVLESPVDVVRLIDEGVEIPEVNVGGVTYKTGYDAAF